MSSTSFLINEDIKTYAANVGGTIAASVGAIDDTICLWDISDNGEYDQIIFDFLIYVHNGNELQVIVPLFKVTCVAFSHDSKFLVAGTYTKQLLLWELSEAQQLLPRPSVELPYPFIFNTKIYSLTSKLKQIRLLQSHSRQMVGIVKLSPLILFFLFDYMKIFGNIDSKRCYFLGE
jgi:WD40 repeat protein